MNAPSQSEQNRRWYDAIGNMTLALLASRYFPPDIQRLIAKNLNAMIDDYRKQPQREPQRQAVSIGSHQRLLGLYKAGWRQRWYDPEPQLHRAVNFMSTVPETLLVEFAEQVLQVDCYIQQQRELYSKYGCLPWFQDSVQDILQPDQARLLESTDSVRLLPGQKKQLPS